MQLVRVLIKSTWWEPTKAKGGDSGGWISSDCYKNVATSASALSLFELSNPEDVNLVVAAIAATKENVPDMHFCILESTTLENLNFKLERRPGNTPVDEANNFHIDVVSLTIDSLREFVHCAVESGSLGKVRKADVKESIRALIAEGRLELSKMNDKLRPLYEN